ncbi:MAG: glucosamine-6-phosphate deaminase [Christensenellaceae bacterium]|jgi:glucosamine-6-phosphate deaminase|nr:glucosamine-6-phosphate deaminase [Christensenellaceae bacterium]
MEIKIFDTYNDVSIEAANIFISTIKNIKFPVVGLATGSTPEGLYKILSDSYKKGIVSFKNVKSFNLDEYIGLSKNHPQSYRSFMNENLFKNIDISLENTFFPDVYDENLSSCCHNYSSLLKANKRDIQILGLGVNGHIAFNEPGTSFDSLTHVVNLTEETIISNSRFFESLEETPTKAITMGIHEILDSSLIILLVSSKNKSAALKKILDQQICIDCPATALLSHPNFIILCDKEAYPY